MRLKGCVYFIYFFTYIPIPTSSLHPTPLYSIDNNLSPTWTQPIVVDYTPGIKLLIEVTIFDKNTKSKDKVMGRAMFDVGEILHAKANMKAKKLLQSDGTTAGKGWVFVHAELAPESTASRYLSLKLSGSDLKNVERIGESDPFYEVSKRTPDGKDWRVIYRSEHVPNDLNPIWKVAEINLHRLCRGDQTKHLQLAVFDYQKNGKHRPMGEVVTTVDGIIGATGFDSKAKPLTLKCEGKGGCGLIHVKRAFFGGDMDDVALSSSRPVSPPRASSRRRVRRLSLIESRPTFSPQSSSSTLGDDINNSNHTTATAPPGMTKKESFSSQKKAPRRSSTNGLSFNGVSYTKAPNNSIHSPPTKPAAEIIKPTPSPKKEPAKAQHRPPQQPEAPARTHQQILSEARLARQKKQSARQHGFKGVWLMMANAGNLDDEELSPQDEECVQSMDAAMAIGTAIRQVLPKSA